MRGREREGERAEGARWVEREREWGREGERVREKDRGREIETESL